MHKVYVLSKCSNCDGKAYLPIGDCEDSNGHRYTRYAPCPTCQGSGNEPEWVSLKDFVRLLHQAHCPHENTSLHGNIRYIAGDIWDDLEEVCDDCGINLDRQ